MKRIGTGCGGCGGHAHDAVAGPLRWRECTHGCGWATCHGCGAGLQLGSSDGQPRACSSCRPGSGPASGAPGAVEPPEIRHGSRGHNGAKHQGFGPPAQGGNIRGTAHIPCMAQGTVTSDGCGTVCMRPDGHAGSHRWCRDDEVLVRLTPAVRAALYRSEQVELEVDHGG